MREKIAIEPDLTLIKDFLSDKGYYIENIEYLGEQPNEGQDFDAYIVSGQASNFLGIHDTNTKAFVINATGLTPDQVYHELRTRLS